MDPDFNIYRDAVEKIPAEDKARLDGYLHGRAETDSEAHEELLAREAEVRRLEDSLEQSRRPLDPGQESTLDPSGGP